MGGVVSQEIYGFYQIEIYSEFESIIIRREGSSKSIQFEIGLIEFK